MHLHDRCAIYLISLSLCGVQEMDTTEERGDGEGASQGAQGTDRTYRLGNSDVRQWSDFLGPYLHPRSLNMINDFGMGPEGKFDNFPFGETFFNGADNVIETPFLANHGALA